MVKKIVFIFLYMFLVIYVGKIFRNKFVVDIFLLLRMIG